MSPEECMRRGQRLARDASADVQENHVAQILAHLKRHRDVGATLTLLEKLPGSPFAERSNRTRTQLTALANLLSGELKRVTSWEDAATIVGWTRRLMLSYHG
jgi:hypothetical protein